MPTELEGDKQRIADLEDELDVLRNAARELVAQLLYHGFKCRGGPVKNLAAFREMLVLLDDRDGE